MPNHGRGRGRKPHGGGGGRGHHGKSRGSGHASSSNFSNYDAPSTSSGSRASHAGPGGVFNFDDDDYGHSKGKRPPGLKGAEIGLYYKMKSQQRKKEMIQRGEDPDAQVRERNAEQEAQQRLTISLPPESEDKILSLLEQLQVTNLNGMTADGESELDLAAKRVRQDFKERYLRNKVANERANDKDLLPIEDDLVETKPSLNLLTGRNLALDLQLQEELHKKWNSNKKYQDMLEKRSKLPAYKIKDAILDVLSKNQVTVISGETGSGKTTQVGQFLLDKCITDGLGSITNIVCTQPRRISAITCAERVSKERGEKLGESIGYSIRLENRMPQKQAGTLLYCTTGIILQRLKEDPNLEKLSHIIVDEVHERDVYCDFLLAMLKDLIIRRPELKVILMSATLNAKSFQEYFENAALFHIPGSTFPVQEFYLEDVLNETRFEYPPARGYGKWQRDFEFFIDPYIKRLNATRKYHPRVINQLARPESEDINYDLIQTLLERICGKDPDNNGVLIFLPGWAEISAMYKQLKQSGRFPENRFLLIPLHSMMPTVNQKEVFNRPPEHQRKIVISTNIAETSVTIDDIVFVIDAGRIKINNYDVNRNIETLDTEFVARSNAIQRRGRAGRVQPGVCYHLFTKHREATFEEAKKPEILRKGLEEVVLQIKSLGLGKAEPFLRKLLDSPKRGSIEKAIERLQLINALDDDEQLTPLGFHLALLPMDPMSGKMILMGCIFSCLDPILSVAASLSFKDPFYTPMGKEKIVDEIRKDFADGTKSDHIGLIRAISGFEEAKDQGSDRQYCHRNFLSYSTVNMLLNFKGQFAQYLYDQHFLDSKNFKDFNLNRNSNNIGLIRGIICAGLYPNVATAYRKGFKKLRLRIETKEDGKVSIHPKSVNSREEYFESPYLIYHEKMKVKSINLYDTTMCTPFPLVFFGGKLDWSNKKTQKGQKKREHMGVDGYIRFNCKKEIFNIVQALRIELDKLLASKIENPGPIVWTGGSNEGALLKAIIELISTEYNSLMHIYESDEDDYEDDSTSDDVLENNFS